MVWPCAQTMILDVEQCSNTFPHFCHLFLFFELQESLCDIDLQSSESDSSKVGFHCIQIQDNNNCNIVIITLIEPG